jgi:adenine-specific DNA-methyltransferase
VSTGDIIHGDCLDVLPTLPDDSVDLIATDPPYYRVKGEEWDRQWKTPALFLAWLDRVLEQFARVLKPNGSLYLFASPKMAARVEVLIRGRFEVLNSIRWRKDAGWQKKARKEDLRGFFDSSETIIFAEHFGADSAAKGEAGYEAKCDELRGFVFEPLRAYFDAERKRSGLTSDQIMDGMARLTGKRYTFARHTFSTSQWELPTRDQYDAARVLFGPGYLLRPYEDLRREYEDLRREYEDLRREYEDLRRPFAVSADVPYTDVWDFPVVRPYSGKHVCEKPLDLCRHIIRASSRPGAVVLDAFLGSGAMGEAALVEGRRFVGIEKDPEWCARARERLGTLDNVVPFRRLPAQPSRIAIESERLPSPRQLSLLELSA